MPVIEAKGLSFEGILSDISLAVDPGELLVVTGPTGCGKSTLLRVLSTLEERFSGEVLLDGVPLSRMSAEELLDWRKQQGVCLSPPGLFDWMTAEDSLRFRLGEMGGESVVPLLAQVGLSHAGHLYPRQMSGGMQKRLGIARALARRPSVLILDDPTAGLDPVTGRAVIELLRPLKGKATIVLATSDAATVNRLADRVLFLHQGTSLFTGSLSEFHHSQSPIVRQFLGYESFGSTS